MNLSDLPHVNILGEHPKDATAGMETLDVSYTGQHD